MKGEDRKAVAVIGDGAMSAGMAFEALNNAGVVRRHADMLVVLNDNDMSIIAAGRRAEPLPGAADERQVLRRRARTRQERC